MTGLQEIAYTLIWFPPLINIVGMWFQVQTNIRLHSAHGISGIMLMLRYLTACAQVLYLYFLDLPFPYRVMILPQWVLLTVLVMQQIWYAKYRKDRVYLSFVTGLILTVWVLSIFTGLLVPTTVGNWAGWIMVLLGAIVQLPQMFKNFQRKSVHGYSLGYVCFSLVAYFFDLSLAYILGVPKQTYVAYGRAIAYRLIELGQFYIYAGRK